jgi:hypothetical protein
MTKRSPLSFVLALSFAGSLAFMAAPANAQVFVSASFGTAPACGWSACPVAIGAAFGEPAYYATYPTYYAPAPAYYAPAYYAPTYYAPSYYAPPVYGASYTYGSPGVGLAVGLGAIGLAAFAPSQPSYAYAPYPSYGYAYAPYAYPASVRTVNNYYRARYSRTILHRPVVVHHATIVRHSTIVAHHSIVRPARAPFSVAHNERARIAHPGVVPVRGAPMRVRPPQR